MNKINIYFFYILLFITLLLASCATVPKTITMPEEKAKEEEEKAKEKEVKPPVETKRIVVHTEEETKSLDLFTQILDLLESTEDRQSVLQQMEELYEEIITEYPNAPLAQESYWKLITIYVENYSPPKYGEAESRYHEFLEKYPKSFFKGFIEDTLGNSYYKHAEWDKLLKLSTPTYQEYVEKGKQPMASLLFMYAEANNNLGNFIEAEKGYKIVIEMFPKLIVGIKSKVMLKKLKNRN